MIKIFPFPVGNHHSLHLSACLLFFNLRASATMGWSENAHLRPEMFLLLHPDLPLNPTHSSEEAAETEKLNVKDGVKMLKVGLFHILCFSTFQMSWTCRARLEFVPGRNTEHVSKLLGKLTFSKLVHAEGSCFLMRQSSRPRLGQLVWVKVQL